MKILILLIIFLHFLQAKAQTSVYHSFPDSNAVWNFHYSVQCPIGTLPSPNADYSIIISGDTIINNLTYRKLCTPTIVVNYNANNCPMPDSGYHGAIREDTITKKVFIFPKYGMNELLYFDFNWEVGDTVLSYVGYYTDTIITIDSVLIGNSYRKRWIFNDCYPIYMIEGIGSSHGLIVPSPGCATDQAYYNLTCFKKDSQILYPDTATSCDIITVSVVELTNPYKNLNMFPNPISGELNILFNLEKPGDVELQLYNSLGQKIKPFSKENFNQDENKISLSLDDIPQGIYFLKIKKGNNEITKKIVKL